MDFMNIIFDIVAAVVLILAGYLGTHIKVLATKYINDATKRKVVSSVVAAVEQVSKSQIGISSEDKLNSAISDATEILANKGIDISEVELRDLIEEAVYKLDIYGTLEAIEIPSAVIVGEGETSEKES